MKEDLPKVYANPIDESLENGQSVFNSMTNDRSIDTFEEEETDVFVKINRIFNASDFVYKKEVEIETDRGISTKTIVGKTSNSLLTIDNENIPISEIRDIKKI